MAKHIDKEGMVELCKLIGKRLKAARKAAKMTEMDIARILGQQGLAQISLAESGDRLPPLLSLVKMARAYAVPLDYLVGLHDDPIADPLESNQAVMLNTLNASMMGCFQTFTSAVAQHAAVTLSGFNTDRSELKEMCVLAVEALSALRRIKEINPEFEEEWRGSARLNSLLLQMSAKGDEFGRRIESERMTIEVIDKEIRVADMHENAEQFMLTFAQ